MNSTYLAAIVRIAEQYRQALRGSWRIASDDDRRDPVDAAHKDAVEQLARLRERYERQVDAERCRLARLAFTPWAGEPADRTFYDELVAKLDKQIRTETDAYRELHEAETRRAEQPFGPMAVIKIAWDRGWRDVVEAGRYEGALTPHDKYGASGPVAALLQFERDLLRPAAFDLAPPEGRS